MTVTQNYLLLFFSYLHNPVVSVKPSESWEMGMSFHSPIISLSSSNLIYTSATFRIGSFDILEVWRKIGKKGWFFHSSYWECRLLQLCDGLTVENVMTHGREWEEAIVFHRQRVKWHKMELSEYFRDFHSNSRSKSFVHIQKDSQEQT